MKEKQYFVYLSFIWGLPFSIYLNCMMLIPPDYSINSFFDIFASLLLVTLTFSFSLLYGFCMVAIFRAIYGKCAYTMLDAVLNLMLFRNTTKAIELYQATLEQIENLNSVENSKNKKTEDCTKYCYLGLIICYAKKHDNEAAKRYVEKYLEYIPENKREKTKNRLYKKYHLNETLPKESYEKKVVKIGVKVLIASILICFGLCLFRSSFYPRPSIFLLAETDNIQTAAEIQELLGYDVDMLRTKDGTKYQIGLYNSSVEKLEVKMLELADSHISNKDISLNLYPRKASKEKIEKILNGVTRIINRLAPVEHSTANITLGQCNIDSDKCEPSFADIEIFAYESADTKNITKIVQNLLMLGIPDLTEENIKIKFNFISDCKNKECKNCPVHYPISTRRYYYLAKEYYNLGNFEKTRQLLLEADKRESEYKTSLEYLDKMQKLNEAIQKNPKDYKLYIQRGDLQNVPYLSMFSDDSSITSDYYGAIKDYEKALELNPKAVEVYGKLASAYMDCGYRKRPYSKLEKDENDYIKAAEYYEKALKYSVDDFETDYIYSQLGYIYEHLNTPQKAIEYYLKISDIYKEPETKIPYLDEPFKTQHYYSLDAINIANLYAQTGNYDKALEILDNVTSKVKTKEIIQDANNLKFLYYWKSKHYKQALKQADKCSSPVCKLIGIVF